MLRILDLGLGAGSPSEGEMPSQCFLQSRQKKKAMAQNMVIAAIPMDMDNTRLTTCRGDIFSPLPWKASQEL